MTEPMNLRKRQRSNSSDIEEQPKKKHNTGTEAIKVHAKYSGKAMSCTNSTDEAMVLDAVVTVLYHLVKPTWVLSNVRNMTFTKRGAGIMEDVQGEDR